VRFAEKIAHQFQVLAKPTEPEVIIMPVL